MEKKQEIIFSQKRLLIIVSFVGLIIILLPFFYFFPRNRSILVFFYPENIVILINAFFMLKLIDIIERIGDRTRNAKFLKMHKDKTQEELAKLNIRRMQKEIKKSGYVFLGGCLMVMAIALITGRSNYIGALLLIVSIVGGEIWYINRGYRLFKNVKNIGLES